MKLAAKSRSQKNKSKREEEFVRRSERRGDESHLQPRSRTRRTAPPRPPPGPCAAPVPSSASGVRGSSSAIPWSSWRRICRDPQRVGAAEHERGGERRRGSRQVHVHAVAEEHRRGPVRLGVAADGARRGDGRREQRQHGERSNGFRYRHSTLTETAGRGGCGRGGGTELLCARWATARDSGPLGASPPISLFRIREATRCVLEASWAARASNRQPRPTEPGTPHRSLENHPRPSPRR